MIIIICYRQHSHKSQRFSNKGLWKNKLGLKILFKKFSLQILLFFLLECELIMYRYFWTILLKICIQRMFVNWKVTEKRKKLGVWKKPISKRTWSSFDIFDKNFKLLFFSGAYFMDDPLINGFNTILSKKKKQFWSIVHDEMKKWNDNPQIKVLDLGINLLIIVSLFCSIFEVYLYRCYLMSQITESNNTIFPVELFWTF